MLKHALAVVLSVTLPLVASATTIQFSSDTTGRSAVDSSQTTLANGDLFLVGTFSNPSALSLSVGSYSAIEAAGGWSQFGGSNSVGTLFNNSAYGGKLLGSQTVVGSAGDPFNGLGIYLIVFNASTAGAATQMGVFRATSAATPWTFPTNGSADDSLTLNMDEVSMAALGTVPIGSVTASDFLLANLVPEPSAIGLAGSGILALLGYRRMRRRA